MDWLPPLADEAMSADQAKAFERACKKLHIEDTADAPAWLRVMAHSPELLKDTYMNLDRNLLRDGALGMTTRLILAATVASHHGRGDLAAFFGERAGAAGATPAQLVEAAGIAATSTSFNTYYKFRSLYDGDEFNGYSAGLRASLFVNPSQGKAMAELINIVISTLNDCKSCVNGHIHDALGADVTRDQIDDAVRVGAIVTSICTFVHSSG